MRRKALMMVFIFSSLIIAISGCSPDLLPVNPSDLVGWCDTDNDGNLVVHVKNQGGVDAGTSSTAVDFGALGTTTVATPAIVAGQTVDVTVPIPDGCFDPDCGFTIEVDFIDEIAEVIETNNSQAGSCLG